MPRRTSIPRKTKYEVVPANRITARFSAKLMKGGKQNLAERILRQAVGGMVRVSGTTTDGLGFTGRGEGLAAVA